MSLLTELGDRLPRRFYKQIAPTGAKRRSFICGIRQQYFETTALHRLRRFQVVGPLKFNLHTFQLLCQEGSGEVSVRVIAFDGVVPSRKQDAAEGRRNSRSVIDDD